METVYRKRVELLYASTEAKSIPLKSAVEAGSIPALLEQVRNKEVRSFAFEEIEKRFDYLGRRLHLDVARAFDWSQFTDETASDFAGWDLAKLGRIYDDRHRVVHRDELPLTTLEELEKVQRFLEKIMFNLALQAKEKHELMLDVSSGILLAELYQRLKADQTAAQPGGEKAAGG